MMKRWLFCLIMYVTLVGCTPASIFTEAQSQSDQIPANTERWLEHDVIDEQEQSQSDQILANTEWLLEYALIDGQEHERPGRLNFYDTSIYISDYCADKRYESISDGAVYIASEQGDFSLAEDKNVFADRRKWVVCEEINLETGVTTVVTSPWFSTAFESVVAYDLKDQELLLYYPEDRSNVLVFQTATPQSPPNEDTLKEVVTPNPAGQILDDTKWVFEHAIIDGEVRKLKAHETLKIIFRPDEVVILDGCNHGAYENEDGHPSYVATENGEFVLPWGERREDGTYTTSYWSTLVACYFVDEESGEEYPIGIPDFMPPFEDIIAYELSADQLRLYYPEDKRNVLVFGAVVFAPQPTELPTQTPEPTMTIMPTQMPSPTPEPMTPLPAYPAPSTPYPPPLTPYPSPVTPSPTPFISYP